MLNCGAAIILFFYYYVTSSGMFMQCSDGVASSILEVLNVAKEMSNSRIRSAGEGGGGCWR